MIRLGLLLTMVACSRPPGPRPPSVADARVTATDGTDETNVHAPSAAPSETRDDRQGETASGFVAASAGELVGHVVDHDGKPLANTTVHLVTKHGERTVNTDRQGEFKAKIAEPTMVVVYGDARVSGSTATTERIGGLEAIDVKAVEAPATQAKPLSDPLAIPAYTDAALDRNAWIRAWLLLEVNETGFVSRVKLLDPPGYDLDAIAVREAFKLKFEPARNRANKPVPSLVVWHFDWPPSVWNRGAGRVPRDVSRLPCRRTPSDAWYSLNRPYRDCSTPNMAAAMTAPWIERPTK